MSAVVAPRRYGTVAPDDNRRTALWVLGIVVIVSLLTSNMLWAQLGEIFGASDTDYHERDAAPPPKLDREMVELIKLTEDPAQMIVEAPETAITRNEAIPFAHGPVVKARPFEPMAADQIARLTALKCLTQAVYFEAGFEPVKGRRAVAQVVLNRMMHPAFPKSVCGVVYQGVNRPVCQFSFTCDGSLKRRPNAEAWKEAEEVALAALNGYVEPSVGYATHYHANYVSPYWAPKLVKLAQIGAHIFYRWPGRWGTPGAFSGRYSGMEAIPAILPRASLAKGGGGAGGDGRTLAAAGDPTAALQDRRAENDNGGRLDTAKGWELAIPAPEEASRASRMIAAQQGGDFDIGLKESGS